MTTSSAQTAQNQNQPAQAALPRIVFLDRSSIAPAVNLVRPATPHEWVSYAHSQDEDVVERLKGATIAIVNKVHVRRDMLEQLPELKFISVAATGFDGVDIEACRERGITVSNVRGYAVHTVPEHTLTLMLSLRRSLLAYRQDVADGKWQAAGQFSFFSHPVADLAGARVGIIGEGSIGQSVGQLCAAFGMEVMFAAHKGEATMGALYTPFSTLLETADIITLHAPLNDATRDMLAMAEFRQMRRAPLIINTARGGLVNEADVVQALDEGLISGIGFDVLSTEPPTPDNPLLKVLDRPNVIVTPHVAWASLDAQQTLWNQVAESLDAFLASTPVRVVV
ncbi:MAG: D-2-hydroxyacid dehydrogenase [Xanthobacter sp.]